MKIISSLILSLVLLPIHPCFAQKGEADLDQFCLNKMRRANVVGMQLAFLSTNETEWIGSYGYANRGSGALINDSTLFMIASCSKPVTALAILKLYNDGLLDLDEDVNAYLTFDLNNPNHPKDIITARMLLAHTSSLKDNWGVLDPLYTTNVGGDSPLKLAEFIKDYFSPEGKYYDASLNFKNDKPAYAWEYCNMAYALLGLIIEEVSGQSFSDYMRNSIFKPLDMHHSYWFLSEIPHSNIARPHVLPERKQDSVKILKHYGFPDFPDGQLRTTVNDYLKFIQLILDKGRLNDMQFIRSEIIEMFHQVQYPNINKHQAIAFNYNEFENGLYYMLMKRLPSHTGGDPGVATVVSFDPNDQVAAVVFMNSPPNTFKGGKILYLDFPRRLLREARNWR